MKEKTKKLLSDEEIKAEFIKLLGRYIAGTNTEDDTYSLFLDLINTQKRLYAKEQFKTEFREMLEGLDAYNFAHTLAIVIFMKTMENTNATDATFTLEGFNQNGVVLGDMVIRATLESENK